MNTKLIKHLFKTLYYFVPLLAFLVIWIPVIKYYHVSNVKITDDTITTARRIPGDSVLDEVRPFFYRPGNEESTKNTIAAAEKILQGEFALCSSGKVSIPFDAEDLEKGLPQCQLRLASFRIPDILISAYEITGRDDFLLTARDVILGWASYERSVWIPKGLLRNDHAISERIRVLSRFWKLYRNHKAFDPDAAKDILQFVARSGQFLAKPAQFTFATNHGFMQNLALLNISLAFPSLPNVDFYKNLALQRLNDQLSFYVNDEGVVLEHSAGYHPAGLEFISMAFRYFNLLNLPVPEGWIVKYEKAKEVYAQLRRPDGTLPMYGDTSNTLDPFGPLVTNFDRERGNSVLDYQYSWSPRQATSLYPVAGYAIWWDGLRGWPDEEYLNQTTIVWSYFPGHAHKHADEMSLLLYAKGQTWWTNMGYGEYGTRKRAEATSWNGSNAPHLVGEVENSVRNTILKFYGSSDDLDFIDLERSSQNNYNARRQVMHVRPDLWIVLDYTSGDKNARSSTIWTTMPNVKLSEGEFPGSYYLKGESKEAALSAFFINSEGTKIKHYKGSDQPFAGWVEDEPSDSLVVEQPSNNTWSAAIWSLEDASGPALHFKGKPYMQEWHNPTQWKITIPVKTGLHIWREGDVIYVNKNNDKIELKLLKTPDGLEDKQREILSAFETVKNKYPAYVPRITSIWKITYILIGIFIFQEIFFLVYRKIRGKHYTSLRVINVLGWSGVIVFLLLKY